MHTTIGLVKSLKAPTRIVLLGPFTHKSNRGSQTNGMWNIQSTLYWTISVPPGNTYAMKSLDLGWEQKTEARKAKRLRGVEAPPKLRLPVCLFCPPYDIKFSTCILAPACLCPKLISLVILLFHAFGKLNLLVLLVATSLFCCVTVAWEFDFQSSSLTQAWHIMFSHSS